MADRELTDALLEVVRERMEQEGVSQGRLARAASVTQPTMSNYFRGAGTPSVDTFAAIATELGTDLEELLMAARRRV